MTEKEAWRGLVASPSHRQSKITVKLRSKPGLSLTPRCWPCITLLPDAEPGMNGPGLQRATAPPEVYAEHHAGQARIPFCILFIRNGILAES